MRKIIGVIFAFIGIAIIFSACGSETYADKLKKQDKVINRFIDTSGIKVINAYPESRVFKDKEYFKDPSTGVYIHVIDSGNKDKITKGSTVYMRFYDSKLLISYPDSLITNDLQNITEFAYMYMDYGNSSSYRRSSYTSGYLSSEYYMYMFLSPGCALPLDYNLGNNAEVSLIVPFDNGSYLQYNSTYEPVYFGRLKYTFRPDQIDTE
ncbi:MAG: DUF4827 domain-containing protein [Prevotella sp.]|jgi:hypothetical protein|nr:DUF4827 domain-containing protein [Prevotella sp.]